MLDPKEKLIDRIKKLIALSGNNPSSEEAAAAAAKAQALLYEHKLSMSDLDTDLGKQEDYDKTEYNLGGNSRTILWKKVLANTIARHNFCSLIAKPGTTHIWLVGKPSDQEIVHYLYAYIGRQIMRLYDEYCKQGGFLKKPDLRAYALGCIAALDEKLKAMRQTSDLNAQASKTGTALILRETHALNTAVQKFFPRLSRGRSYSIGNHGAYQAGRRDGANLTIRSGVSGRAGGYQITGR